MARTIQQTVEFRVPPETLFDVYMDSKAHSAAIGAKASVSRRVGGRFTAFGRALLGRNLALVPRRMIVQSWRGAYWKKTDLDSVLILSFSKGRGGGRITLVHANVPDKYHASIRKGWNTYYWKRWKAYLAQPGTEARRRR